MADTEQERLVLETVSAFFDGSAELEPLGAPGIDGVIVLPDAQQIGLSITSIAASADYYLNKETSKRAQLWQALLNKLKKEFPGSEIEILVPEDGDPSIAIRDQVYTELLHGIRSLESGEHCRGENVTAMGLEAFVVKEACQFEDAGLADVWVYFKGAVNYQTKMLELLEKKAASVQKARHCDSYDLAIDIVDTQLVNPRRLRRVIVDYCAEYSLPFQRIYLVRAGQVLTIIDAQSGAVFSAH